ncbi:hypothetical protein ABB37_06151 [Leptomonas pyrrhocoris]|uniref:Uncharacterized protein n=1 Tax=Leptomonas pyrrhocoris TaxID=157538 RepID=A0A0N0VEP4_LEPPY|nr:hypothetical protein ABB37_06151 [Leptomonas pyrrhocoris]KPA78551.1 hypothetical protein ABB37_06151 [Leptomonas pyrrhocoris]|eukprot:XP_015656990.1 hypothetical protein ABB37_06151 [Leptomonas pyrrhocoris]
MGNRFRSSWLHYVSAHVLMVPARQAVEPMATHMAKNRAHDDPSAFTRTHSRVDEATDGAVAGEATTTPSPSPSSSPPFSFLLDVANLPCGAGVRTPASLVSAADPQWMAHVRNASDHSGAFSENTGLRNPLTELLQDTPSVHEEGSNGGREEAALPARVLTSCPKACDTSSGVRSSPLQKAETSAGAAVWSLRVAHTDVQVCADVSSVSLRSFALQELGQRVPSLLFLAEKPYAVGDEDVMDCVACLDNDTTSATVIDSPSRVSDSAGSAVVRAARRVPIEAYAERTPLIQTCGTAALQLSLQRALAAATWLTQTAKEEPGSHTCVSAPCGESPRHLVWHEKDWVVEADGQLAAMEEQLLPLFSQECVNGSTLTCAARKKQPPRQQQQQQLACASSANVPLRAWLPSRWAPSSKSTAMALLSTMVPRTYSAKELKSDLCGCRSHLTADWALPAGAAPHRTACKSWTFRLHKSWLVTGLRQSPPSLPTFAQHSRNSVGAAAGSSAVSLHVCRDEPLRLFNYDLHTGMPLNLLWHRLGLSMKPKQQQQQREEEFGTGLPSLCTRSGGGSRPTASSTPVSPARKADGCNTAASAITFTSTDTWMESSPFQRATRSRQVGWVRMERTSGSSSSRAGRSPQWRLPPGIPSFVIPDDAARVRAPRLTDNAARPSPSSSAVSVPSCCAGVTVPQREWYTGFFAHDAPLWWKDAVLHALRMKASPQDAHRAKTDSNNGGCPQPQMGTSPQNISDHDGGRVLRDGNGYGLIDELIQQRHIPALPDGVVSTVDSGIPNPSAADAANGLTVCVLRLRPFPPTFIKKAEDQKTSSTIPQLFWTTIHDDSSVATVNFVFTLKDILEMHAVVPSVSGDVLRDKPAATALGKKNFLLFMEVKAAFEVLRRATSAADASPNTPYRWWPLLDNFYRTHTVKWEAGDTHRTPFDAMAEEPASASATHGDVHPAHSVDENDFMERSGSQTAVPAYCHPTPLEMAREFVRLVTQPPSARVSSTNAPFELLRCAEHDELVSEGSGQSNNSKGNSPHAMLTEWPRAAYHKLMHVDLFTPSNSSSAQGEENDDGGAEHGEDDDVLDAILDRNGDLLGEGGLDREKAGMAPPDAPQLPFGVEVHRYDEDGTRLYGLESDEGGSIKSSGAADATDAERNNTCAPPPFLLPSVTGHDWPAVDRRPFLRGNHRLEDAIRPPTTSRTALAAGGERQKPPVPYMHFPALPPVAVGTLGIKRARSIVAAHEQSKRYGYLPVGVGWRRDGQQGLGHNKHIEAPSCGRAASTLSANSGSTTSSSDEAAEEAAATAKSESMVDNAANAAETSPQGETFGDGVAVPSSVGIPSSRNVEGKWEQDNATSNVAVSSLESKAAVSALAAGADRVRDDRGAVPGVTGPLDVVETLLHDEERAFLRLWRPWLKYLPPEWPPHIVQPPNSHDSDASFMAGQLSNVIAIAIASDPQLAFPFLRPSRLRACHLRRATSDSHTEDGETVHAEDHRRTSKDESTGVCDDIVQAYDLGLCILHLSYDEVYVNASNLIFQNSVTES